MPLGRIVIVLSRVSIVEIQNLVSRRPPMFRHDARHMELTDCCATASSRNKVILFQGYRNPVRPSKRAIPSRDMDSAFEEIEILWKCLNIEVRSENLDLFSSLRSLSDLYPSLCSNLRHSRPRTADCRQLEVSATRSCVTPFT
jgi:hypothetical protein